MNALNCVVLTATIEWRMAASNEKERNFGDDFTAHSEGCCASISSECCISDSNVQNYDVHGRNDDDGQQNSSQGVWRIFKKGGGWSSRSGL